MCSLPTLDDNSLVTREITLFSQMVGGGYYSINLLFLFLPRNKDFFVIEVDDDTFGKTELYTTYSMYSAYKYRIVTSMPVLANCTQLFRLFN